jgi:hypothetical protein
MGVSIYAASGVDMQVVSIYTTSGVDMKGVSIYTKQQCGLRTSSVYPSTPPAVWTCRMHPSPSPAMWTCTCAILFTFAAFLKCRNAGLSGIWSFGYPEMSDAGMPISAASASMLIYRFAGLTLLRTDFVTHITLNLFLNKKQAHRTELVMQKRIQSLSSTGILFIIFCTYSGYIY